MSKSEPIVFIGIASKSGPAHHAVTDTIARVGVDARHFGIKEIIHKWETRGDVNIGRSFLVQAFLDHPARPDYLLSLDDDIAGWTARDLARCIESGEGYVGAVVPSRTFRPDILADAVQRGTPPGELGFHLSMTLVGLLPEDLARFEGGDLARLDELHRGHLLAVRWTSLGWTLLSREAIEAMVTALPERERVSTYQKGMTYPRLFRFTENEKGEMLDDSTWLANHWRACGGTVWLDTASSVTLCHFGVHPFFSAPFVERARMMFGGARHPRAGG